MPPWCVRVGARPLLIEQCVCCFWCRVGVRGRKRGARWVKGRGRLGIYGAWGRTRRGKAARASENCGPVRCRDAHGSGNTAPMLDDWSVRRVYSSLGHGAVQWLAWWMQDTHSLGFAGTKTTGIMGVPANERRHCSWTSLLSYWCSATFWKTRNVAIQKNSHKHIR
jgi:hypothetical protein